MGEARPFSQGFNQNRFIARPIMRWTECPAHGVIDKSAARGRDFQHDIERGADYERGNALGFDDVGDETDGLVAKRSIRHQQRRIHLGALQFAGNGGGDFGLDLLVATEPSHERDVKRRQRADHAAFGQHRQRRARKDDLRILARHPTDAGVVVDDDLARCRIRGDQAVRPIVARNERFLIGKPERRAGKERKARLAQAAFLSDTRQGLTALPERAAAWAHQPVP